MTSRQTGAKRMSGADRRASIVEAATNEFTRLGYQRTRMADIAQRLGVTEPVVFQNFGSKAALYSTVLEHAAEQLCAWIDERIAQAVPVRDFLTEVLGPGHLDRMHEQGSPGVLFADAVSLASEPEIEEAARRSVRKVARVLTRLFEHGQARGELPPQLDATDAAWWLLSFFASHRFRTAVMPNRVAREADLGRLMLHALTGG